MEKKFGNSKLQELLDKYCPNGVEYMPLGKVCKHHDNERKPIAKARRVVGSYPYYGANGIQDYVDDYIFDGCYVLVGEDGSVITDSGNPVVIWAEGKFWVNNHAHIISSNDGVLLRYVFYCLQSVDVSSLIHGNIPKLTGKDFKNIQIPIPPMPVQEEIVRILDSFTALETALETALMSELEMRKKQYEYYRDNLLDFEMFSKENISALRTQIDKNTVKFTDVQQFVWQLVQKFAPEGVEYDRLGNKELFLYKYGKGNNIPPDIGGIYPVYGANGIVSHINEYNCDNVSIIGHIGAVGLVNRSKGKCFVTYNGTIADINNKDKIDSQYFYYILTSLDLPLYKKGSQPFLSVSDFERIKIPIPPKPMQDEIVKILDKFNDLTTDIQKGLPAEIEMRRKQYEYYRDKLLSFDRADGQ